MDDTQIFAESSTVSVLASSVVSTAALGAALNEVTVRVCNAGDSVVYVKFGAAGVTVSVSTGIPILPKSAELFRIGYPGASHFAAITEAQATPSRLSMSIGLGEV
jgi:hypothetical protein